MTRTRSGEVESHLNDEVAYWRIIEGSRTNCYPGEPMKDIVHGRFYDAVAYAIQQPEFYGDWLSHDDPSNCNHGKIEKINVRELKDTGLVVKAEN